MSDTKKRIIEAAWKLLEERGFHATSINEIVAHSNAPKGSIYYYFPGGKDQIAAEAIAAAGDKTAERILENLKDTVKISEGISDFVRRVADQMEKSGYAAGSPLSVVAVETSTIEGPVNAACKAAYEKMIRVFTDVLVAHAFNVEEAALWAEQIVITLEGGILLGRTFHSREPLVRAGKYLARALSKSINQKNEVKK